jgi:hypothetical protein
MEIVRVAQKERYMNNLEKHHIYCAHQQGIQMNEILFDLQNLIFDTIYNYYAKQKHNTHTQNPRHTSRQHYTHRHIHVIQTNENITAPHTSNNTQKTQGKQHEKWQNNSHMQLNTHHYTNKYSYYISEQSRTRTPRKQHIRIKTKNKNWMLL